VPTPGSSVSAVTPDLPPPSTGLIGLTMSRALGFSADGTRINAIYPCIIDIPMMERFFGGTPEGTHG
jgi:NAD(P)-dependent dehydrogenase (short-subunit alcohol dehydrogenase family)